MSLEFDVFQGAPGSSTSDHLGLEEPVPRHRALDDHRDGALAYAERLCAAHPGANRLLVRVAIALHDTGWARVDEDRILSEGFTGDWRKAEIRFEHERQGCLIAREVLPPLGYDADFVEAVCAIIDGHDTRQEAYSLEDALVRDADRLWRFDHAGIALASGWFRMDPAVYSDRLEAEIIPELITAAAVEIATAELARSRALLKDGGAPVAEASPVATLDRVPRWTHTDDVFVDGRWRTSSATARIVQVDPATGREWGSVPDASAEDVDAAMAAADQAFRAGPWATSTPSQRAAMLLRVADELEARAEEMALTNTLENGSPVSETRGAAANAAGIFRHVAGLADWVEAEDVRPFPAGGAETVVRKDPLGPCVLIAPWNFPINLMVIKLAPALLAGNTVVMKPAPGTSLSIRFVVEACEAAGLPPGVVNLVTGGGEVGDRLVRHASTAKVAFTGSTPVGRRIAAACGELLRPVTLELGGKSSAIVLEDADLDDMSSVLVRTCLRNTGQTCYISTRILAPASRYDEVVEMVTRTVAAAPQGDPFDEATVFGPMASEMQYDVVRGHLESAHAEGARATTGGRPADTPGGWFIEPTVFADVTPDMRIAREEVFGPVVSVIRYDNVDEAVALANDTSFGLGGVVFSADQATAMAVAERMDTGSVGLNFFGSNHNAPFGGRHDSGLGVEYGVEGLTQYIAYKSIHRPLG